MIKVEKGGDEYCYHHLLWEFRASALLMVGSTPSSEWAVKFFALICFAVDSIKKAPYGHQPLDHNEKTIYHNVGFATFPLDHFLFFELLLTGRWVNLPRLSELREVKRNRNPYKFSWVSIHRISPTEFPRENVTSAPAVTPFAWGEFNLNWLVRFGRFGCPRSTNSNLELFSFVTCTYCRYGRMLGVGTSVLKGVYVCVYVCMCILLH